jgi:glutathione S-transferase
MKLYIYPGACSLADHIALIEAGLPFQIVRLDHEKKTEDGRDFLTINPRGYVPALELDDGSILTENLAILAYIADHEGSGLPLEVRTRWRALEAISFLSTEVHGSLGPFFKKRPAPEQDRAREALIKHFGSVAEQLGDKAFLLGDRMTVADCYLFWTLRAAPISGIELPEALQAYHGRLSQMPSVRQALANEGLA